MEKEEAIKVIRKNYPHVSSSGSEFETALRAIIPELAESEDEKIMKRIHLCLDECVHSDIIHDYERDECLAYLEKQKEFLHISKTCKENPDSFTDEDARMRKDIVAAIEMYKDFSQGRKEEIYAYLEKQKEPLTIPDKFSGLKSLMLQYLQSAANRKDDVEIESDTDLWGRKILDYVWKYSDEQKEQIPITESKRLANEVIEFLTWCGYSPVLKDDPKKEHFHIDIPRHEDDFWLSEEYKHCRSVLGEYYMEGDYGGDTYTLYIWRTKKEQKPAEWSEEDEAFLKVAIAICNRYSHKDIADWLKSLRPQPKRNCKDCAMFLNGECTKPHWKPSEDEERLINTSISFLKDFADKGYENAVECIDWLKSKSNGNSGK